MFDRGERGFHKPIDSLDNVFRFRMEGFQLHKPRRQGAFKSGDPVGGFQTRANTGFVIPQESFRNSLNPGTDQKPCSRK